MVILPLHHSANHAYVGRFAPSPTGPLHLGSLFTALASFLDARSHKGKWLLRIDDLDTPRNKEGSVDAILKTLEVFGLHWDGSVCYQNQHLDKYEDLLHQLEQNQLTYRCTCSRKSLAEMFSGDRLNSKHSVYPGNCRNKAIPARIPHAIRLKVDPCTLTFNDELQGLISHDLAQQHGDFILKRKDGIIAYQFAVVVDDYLQGINHVVRGRDLFEETPKQIYLQQLLGFPTPTYMHVPVIVDQQGYKLSKQTLATAVDTQLPNKILFDLLVLLKQNPPDELGGASINELLDWAIGNWQPDDLALCCTINA
ncbi:MAG: tRNA glutamyl-Q(34) synthetase GluQRS [Methyloglobulus sp.]|nr:tRNA glutamyl-Q(34) synthetase GluQRS [Methyloglobulus sp.]